MARASGRAKLAPLTSLRFFAAAAIVAHHMQGYWVEPGRWLPFLLDQAVGFFFVLSGFILTYVYPELTNREARRRFLQARFARIWPAHLAALVVLFLLIGEPGHVGTGLTRAGVTLSNLAMVHGWIPLRDVFFSYNGPSWSISTEFGFYLLFPFLVYRFAATWWWKLVGALGLALGIAWICDRIGIPPTEVAPGMSVSAGGLLYVNPLARLFEFVLGMCSALLFERLRGRLRPGAIAATGLEVAALALMVVNAGYAAHLTYVWQRDGWVGPSLALWLVHGGVCSLAFALVILVFALGRGWLSRLLSLPGLVVLGEISFSMYLLHYILLRAVGQRQEAFDELPIALQVTGYFAILLVLSHWIWAAVERPLRARILALGQRGAVSREARSAPGALAALLAPSRRVLAGEALLVVALLGGAHIAATRASSLAGPAAYALATDPAHTDPSLRNVRFGALLSLRSIAAERRETALDLALAWRTLRELPSGSLVALHVLDRDGRIVAQGDYAIHPDRAAGRRDLDRVRIESVPSTAARLGIAVRPPGRRPLAIDRGERDWENTRLLVDLPSLPVAEASAAGGH